ncbi:hypothetical protein AB0912_28660 [Streptomyces sp. NPDC007084]|uniref:hypothetical protein n=1 Tax=Streptomyces sp. NPDC007084 TaxID=3154313 RepID=UPI0034512BBB
MNQKEADWWPAGSRYGTVDLDGARRSLRRGQALVLPTPHPLTGFLVTADPYVTWKLTGNWMEPLALLVKSFEATLREHVELDGFARDVARRLLAFSSLRVVLPLANGGDHPFWMSPAVRETHVWAQGVPWDAARRLLTGDVPLYCAEARRPGGRPVTRTRRAILEFPLTVSVLGHRTLYGLDESADPVLDAERSAPTAVAVTPDGALRLVTSGAHDRHADDKVRWLSDLGAWCVGEMRQGAFEH